MNNLKEYFHQLESREKLILIIAMVLILTVVFKLFIFDTLSNQQINLSKRASLAANLQSEIAKITTKPLAANAQQESNLLINDYLKNHAITGKIKQIRNTAKGEKQLEIEGIVFENLVSLLDILQNNDTQLSGLQIKSNTSPGTVNATLTFAN
ncbi:MAG: hypothetical protein HKN88_04825 [Gammaproteobacteria bacterium]|nr:type II secretion system protein M [Gammaproteobacteria bacterium]NNC97377.1 hypothetical protein [Gammaproteobacteria bacterium]NNM13104.1 hypothetical protein [Gammaproteobacteria bacterium]